MNKRMTVLMTVCLPLLVQAAEVVQFDANLHVTTNSPNSFYFALDPSVPVVSQKTTEGYSGPDIYGAMDMSAGAFWRVARKNESGMSIRLNRSTDNWANGLFLMPVDSVRFDKQYNTMYALDIFTSQIQRLESATIRFVIQAGGKFYISEPSPNFCVGYNGHQKDLYTLNVLKAEWFNYDPVASPESVSVIGSKASPKFTDIGFAGFALFAKGAQTEEGVNFGVRSFSVEAKQ